MKNDFLEYYGKHNISPVKQDVSNIEIHYERRKKLYRQLGIPTIAFRNAEILEVGPGGGYNTLAFFHWNVKHVDLVEANPKGREDMQQLFVQQGIAEEKYEIFPYKIEEYKTKKKYDIIIAEGFLPLIYNQQEVINKLQELINENGIIVVTCSEDICFFIELMKRLVGIMIVADIPEYDQKVEYLADFFKPQLARLRGVSRSPEDWVQDQILSPTIVNEAELTMSQAINYFGENFDVLGCSPNLFTDYSWYKDIWCNYKEDYREQFRRKRFSLLMANMQEVILPVEAADILEKHFKEIKRLEADYERTFDVDKVSSIIKEMDSMDSLLQQNFEVEFTNVFHEIKEALLCLLQEKKVNMNKYPCFFSAFGRTQQYISFVKR